MRGEGTPNKALIIGAIIVILLIGAIFFALSGSIFKSPQEAARPVVKEVTTSRSVRMTVDGPIIANEDRQSYRITVGYERRIAEGLKTYTRDVVATQTYDNNRTAFQEFVSALDRAGYDKRRTVSDKASDPSGVCPKGQRYTFEILDSGRVIDTAWTTSCGDTKGTLGVSGTTLKTLFNSQISGLRTAIAPITLQ